MTTFAVKPSRHLVLNPGHPLSSGIILDCPMVKSYGSVLDVSGNSRHGTLTGTAFGYGPRGYVRQHTATTDKVNFGASDFIPISGGFTAVLIQKKRDATLRVCSAFGLDNGTNAIRCGAHIPYSDGTVYFDYGGLANGTTRVQVASLTFGEDIWIITTGPRGMEIWQNGIKRASNSANPSRTANAALNMNLGRHSSVTASDLVDFSLFRLYNRQLPVTGILQTSLNPWQIYLDDDESWIPAITATATGSRRRRVLMGVTG